MATQLQLTQALAALHDLQIGKAKVSISIGTGAASRSVTFTRTTIDQLERYIASLRQSLAGVAPKRNRLSYFVPD